MGEVIRYRHPQYFVHSLRKYVLSPVLTASRLVAREQSEITAELNAFEDFRDRLATIEPMPTTLGPPRTERLSYHKRTNDQMNRVRTAFRETVMSTPHYDDVYHEPLLDHLAGEFTAAVADGAKDESTVVFTVLYKDTLKEGTTQVIDRRQRFLEILENEIESLDCTQAALTTILSTIDTTVIPEWYRESLRGQIDDIARQRQEVLRTQLSLPHLNGHSFCAYLYTDTPWTYPALTAVARLRESLILEESSVDESLSHV